MSPKEPQCVSYVILLTSISVVGSRLWPRRWSCLRDLDFLSVPFCHFSIRKAPSYTKAMGFQLLYWSYLQDIKHPVLTLLDSSPASFVGEDIELSLSLLSNYTSTTNLARETDPLHESYQKLSLLMHIAHKVRDYRISHFGVRVNDERDCSSQPTVLKRRKSNCLAVD